MKNLIQFPEKFSVVFTTIALLLLLIASESYPGISPVFATRTKDVVQRHILPGHLVPLLNNIPPIGQTPKDTLLHLSIGLALQHQPALNALLAVQSNPASALYHHYLTPQQFKFLFSPQQSTVDHIVSFLHNQGLHVDTIAANNSFITTSGTAAVIEKAFSTTLNQYRLNGRLVYAPLVDPSVPLELAPFIQTIGGLDDVAHYHPLGLSRKTLLPGTSSWQGYTPNELRTAYDVNPLIKAGMNGTGQTVALFELDGYHPADINTYRKRYQLGLGKYSNVLVGNTSNTQGDGTSEVTLDMEVLSAIAPGATQKVYIGNNTVAGVNATYNQIVTDDVASVVSTSWGECEQASGQAELQALDNIFKQGAAQGQSFFAASGDQGVYDCQDSAHLAVDMPAADPYVVGVGGTTLTTGMNGTYLGEIAWGSSTKLQKVGGGGGISAYFPRPSYQHDLAPTTPYRLVPDVSANADPVTGYNIYCTGTSALCTGWSKVGGTSGATPLWAAIAADVNHYLVSHNHIPLGNANAVLYVASTITKPFIAFHDITRGPNLYYPAHVGYDLATGLGTPDAWNLAQDVATLPAHALLN